MVGTAPRRRRELTAIALLSLLPGLLCLAVIVTVRLNHEEPLCKRAAGASQERRRLNTGDGRTVVVIGDSYAIGAGVEPYQSWPVRLPGRVHVDAFGGSGFSADASPCGAVSYADRAERAVGGRGRAFVVVQGGLNDVTQSETAIRNGFYLLMRELEGHEVLVVGPSPAPTRAARAPRVDALLAELSRDVGVPYLSVLDVDLDYLDDGLHPSVAGQEVLGDVVADTVIALDDTLDDTPDDSPDDGGPVRPSVLQAQREARTRTHGLGRLGP